MPNSATETVRIESYEDADFSVVHARPPGPAGVAEIDMPANTVVAVDRFSGRLCHLWLPAQIAGWPTFAADAAALGRPGQDRQTLPMSPVLLSVCRLALLEAVRGDVENDEAAGLWAGEAFLLEQRTNPDGHLSSNFDRAVDVLGELNDRLDVDRLPQQIRVTLLEVALAVQFAAGEMPELRRLVDRLQVERLPLDDDEVDARFRRLVGTAAPLRSAPLLETLTAAGSAVTRGHPSALPNSGELSLRAMFLPAPLTQLTGTWRRDRTQGPEFIHFDVVLPEDVPAELTSGVWATVYTDDEGVLIAISKMYLDDRGWHATLEIPSHLPTDQIVLELTVNPDIPPLDRRSRRIREAVNQGVIAADVERRLQTGAAVEATAMADVGNAWSKCANLWDDAADKQRSAVASAYAADAYTRANEITPVRKYRESIRLLKAQAQMATTISDEVLTVAAPFLAERVRPLLAGR